MPVRQTAQVSVSDERAGDGRVVWLAACWQTLLMVRPFREVARLTHPVTQLARGARLIKLALGRGLPKRVSDRPHRSLAEGKARLFWEDDRLLRARRANDPNDRQE